MTKRETKWIVKPETVIVQIRTEPTCQSVKYLAHQVSTNIMQPSSSFEIDSHVKGYHAYLDDWKPCCGEVLQAIPEPNNAVDKYAVCVLKDGEVVGHLKRGKRGRFAKTIFYFLEADQHSSCSVIIKADKAVNFGDGEGMQVPCKLRISGQEKFLNILKKELERLEK